MAPSHIAALFGVNTRRESGQYVWLPAWRHCRELREASRAREMDALRRLPDAAAT